ncbi:hypothetical protein ACFV0W_29260, partial [Streptomyces anulatus]
MTGDRHDVGLLSPVWAGGGVEPLVSDRAYLEAMLEVEVALAETQAGLGIIPASSVGPIRAAARSGRIEPVARAHRERPGADPRRGRGRARSPGGGGGGPRGGAGPPGAGRRRAGGGGRVRRGEGRGDGRGRGWRGGGG